MTGCTKPPISMEADPPWSAQNLQVDTLAVWPVSAPANRLSTYGIRLYVKSATGAAHVGGVTLSLTADDPNVTGRECRPFPGPVTVAGANPIQIADSRICRIHEPVGSAAASATLAVMYWDDANHTGMLRTTVSLPPLTDDPVLEVQEFSIKTFHETGGVSYEPILAVHETNGGAAVITALKFNADGGRFDDECSWRAPTLDPYATWSSVSLSYCAPFLSASNSSTAPTTVTAELTYESPVGSHAAKTLRATTTIAP
jgi:hypothetical protein